MTILLADRDEQQASWLTRCTARAAQASCPRIHAAFACYERETRAKAKDVRHWQK